MSRKKCMTVCRKTTRKGINTSLCWACQNTPSGSWPTRPTHLGGIGFRFSYEHSVGLIKVIPGAAHGARPPIMQPSPPRRNSLTNACIPRPRAPMANTTNGWPTLVLETGVSESLPHLRQDAAWWFGSGVIQCPERVHLLCSV